MADNSGILDVKSWFLDIDWTGICGSMVFIEPIICGSVVMIGS